MSKKKRVKFNDIVEIRYIDNNSTKSIPSYSNKKYTFNKYYSIIILLVITITLCLFFL